MKAHKIERVATIWLEDGVPARMLYDGKRWKITDMPTRLRDSVWSVQPGHPGGLYGWRFQATGEHSESVVFDVYPTEDGWHVHLTYA